MILAWAGQKGGAGKSTLAIATAAELHRQGYKTLLIDADPQGTSTTWGNVAAEVAESDACFTFPTVISMGGNLKEQVSGLAKNYDFTVIDCPGRIDSAQRAALAIADLALIPVTPDTTDVWALSGSIELVELAKEFRDDLKCFLVLNKIHSSTAEAETARETFLPAGIPIFNAQLGQRVTFTRFASVGLGVVDYEPGKKAARETEALVQEILGHRSQNEH